MSELQKRLQMNRLPPMPPKNVGGSAAVKKRGVGRVRRDYSPLLWDQYFSSKRDIVVKNNSFRVYETGSGGPVCFFLHGGGFSALSWAVLSKILVGLVSCQAAAMDFRGHGDSYTDDDEAMAGDTLAQDVGDVIQELYGNNQPPIFLIGHSMGGAVAVRAAAQQRIPSLIGLVVIDVVEGTALDALTSMQALLRGRPAKFKTLEEAIEWCIRSGHIRNLESARISMVGQLKKRQTNETATEAISHEPEPSPAVVGSSTSTITEEDEDDVPSGSNSSQHVTHNEDQTFTAPASVSSQIRVETDEYTWRIDLTRTEPYWRGWFEGLSQLFLSCTVPKLLLLAGVDRLDKDLTIGQMQGKFQMQVLPQCGHAVHEDSPDKVADVIANFLVRHKMAEATSNFQRSFPSC